MTFEQLYAPSLKELFVQKLQGMILSGELSMGEKLPSERELCQQMGVSQNWPDRGFLKCVPVRALLLPTIVGMAIWKL